MKTDDRVSNYMALLNGEAVELYAPPVAGIGSQVIAEAVTYSTTAPLAEDEIRRERLNLIRQQLAEGSYNISGKDVADKIIKVLKN